MIFKCVLICALAACAVAPALGSSVKGYTAQREVSKTSIREEQHQVKQRLEHVEPQQHAEQQPLLLAEQREEDKEIQQQKELSKTTQIKEEAPVKAPLKYEAKPQIKLEEQKGGAKFEQVKQQVEQQERYEAAEEPQEQAHLTQEQYEVQQHHLVEEQRRYDEPLVQPIQPLTVVDEVRNQVKGGAAAVVQAPIGEPEPYAFSYQVDGSSRSESGDIKGVVRGQYTLQGADGASRIVDYVADHNGFRATVNTNEFGTESKSPANVALRTSQPTAEDITLKLEGKTKEENLQSGLKGGPQIVAVKAQYPEDVKGSPKRAPLELAPIKGQRLVHQQEELPQQEAAHEYQAPIKSAELRSPRLIGSELKPAPQPQSRSTFESATAHRAVYRAPPTYVARPAPVLALRPPVREQVPAVSRAHLQRERYPPSPVFLGHPGYRRQTVPVNPRVSFYSPSSVSHFDDEQPSFETDA